jgi:hypothetical protein
VAVAARKAQKKRQATQQGRKSTIITGPRGISGEAETRKKTLLGQ